MSHRALGPQWKEQTVDVQGKQHRLGDVHGGGQWFHASPHDIAPGTVLEPGKAEKNYKQSSDAHVSIASAESYAKRWHPTGHLYEVEPLHEVEVHRAGPADYGKSFQVFEGRVARARVVRKLGVEPDSA